MKWLKIASAFFLCLVLVIFALIGLLYATRGTPARAVHSFSAPAGPPAVGSADFLRSIELLTHTQIRGGHGVELLLNGGATFPRIWQDLRAARHSITLQLYYCKPGAVADSLKRIISERARAGVRVLMLLDAFGAQDLSEGYLDSLRMAGVRVATFRPLRWYTLHKAQNRSHIRAIIVDEQIGYTGGFGLADVWLGDGRTEGQWRETNVRFTGPAVAQMQAAFAIGWAEATGVVLATGADFPVAGRAAEGTGQRAGLLYAVPSMGSTPAERFLVLSLAGARTRLWITNAYFVPDDELRRLLTDAARRGVDVRVLTAGPHTDVGLVRHAGHALYSELLRGGVRIFEYQPTMIHAKTMVVDGIWATVGTMNFDNRSLAFNDESNLLVDDARFARQLEQVFLDDLRYAREIRIERFSKRSRFRKLLDAASGRFVEIL